MSNYLQDIRISNLEKSVKDIQIEISTHVGVPISSDLDMNHYSITNVQTLKLEDESKEDHTLSVNAEGALFVDGNSVLSNNLISGNLDMNGHDVTDLGSISFSDSANLTSIYDSVNTVNRLLYDNQQVVTYDGNNNNVLTLKDLHAENYNFTDGSSLQSIFTENTNDLKYNDDVVITDNNISQYIHSNIAGNLDMSSYQIEFGENNDATISYDSTENTLNINTSDETKTISINSQLNANNGIFLNTNNKRISGIDILDFSNGKNVSLDGANLQYDGQNIVTETSEGQIFTTDLILNNQGGIAWNYVNNESSNNMGYNASENQVECQGNYLFDDVLNVQGTTIARDLWIDGNPSQTIKFYDTGSLEGTLSYTNGLLLLDGNEISTSSSTSKKLITFDTSQSGLVGGDLRGTYTNWTAGSGQGDNYLFQYRATFNTKVPNDDSFVVKIQSLDENTDYLTLSGNSIKFSDGNSYGYRSVEITIVLGYNPSSAEGQYTWLGLEALRQGAQAGAELNVNVVYSSSEGGTLTYTSVQQCLFSDTSYNKDLQLSSSAEGITLTNLSTLETSIIPLKKSVLSNVQDDTHYQEILTKYNYGGYIDYEFICDDEDATSTQTGKIYYKNVAGTCTILNWNRESYNFSSTITYSVVSDNKIKFSITNNDNDEFNYKFTYEDHSRLRNVQAPTISYTSDISVTEGDEVNASVSITNPPQSQSYSISPSLENGLSINELTGAITGTANGVLAQTTFTVTLNGLYSTTLNISIASNSAPSLTTDQLSAHWSGTSYAGEYTWVDEINSYALSVINTSHVANKYVSRGFVTHELSIPSGLSLNNDPYTIVVCWRPTINVTTIGTMVYFNWSQAGPSNRNYRQSFWLHANGTSTEAYSGTVVGYGDVNSQASGIYSYKLNTWCVQFINWDGTNMKLASVYYDDNANLRIGHNGPLANSLPQDVPVTKVKVTALGGDIADIAYYEKSLSDADMLSNAQYLLGLTDAF